MQLHSLGAALRPLMPCPEIDALQGLLDSPHRWVVVGRTSAGKTSFINGMAHSQAPVGLGGITTASYEVPDGPLTWVDTPGIDGRDRAIDTLGPLLDEADGVIWVVDGLQPMTRTEREVLALLLPPALATVIVISKSDLVGPDLPAIEARVRTLAAPHNPLSIQSANLREERIEAPVSAASFRRETAKAKTLQALRERFQALPQPIGSATLQGILDVRGPTKQALARVQKVRTVQEMVRVFEDELRAIADAVVIRLASHRALSTAAARLPALADPPQAASGALDALRLGAAGPLGCHRELAGLAASWAAEVSVQLADWADTIATDDLGAAAWTLADDALKQAETALHTTQSA